MNDKLRRLYFNAKKYFELPDFEQFAVDMQDADKMARLRENMLEHYEMPEIEVMYQDFGVKKKDLSVTSPQENLDLPTLPEQEVTSLDTKAVEPPTDDELITSDLTSQSEESVVPELEYLYGDKGFKFEQTGFGDYVKITAPNGSQETFALLKGKRAKNQAIQIKDFISSNREDSVLKPTGDTPLEVNLKNLENQSTESEKKFYNKEEYTEFVNQFQDKQSEAAIDIKSYLKKYDNNQRQENYFNSLAYRQLISKDPVLAANQLAAFKQEKIAIENLRKDLLKKQEALKLENVDYQRAVGRYVGKESLKGTYIGNFFQEIGTGTGTLLSGLSNINIDLIMGVGLVDQEDLPYFNQTVIEKLINDHGSVAAGLGLNPNSEEYREIDPEGDLAKLSDLNYEDWKAATTEDERQMIRDEARALFPGKKIEDHFRLKYIQEKYLKYSLDPSVLKNAREYLNKNMGKELESEALDDFKKTFKNQELPGYRDAFEPMRKLTGVTKEYGDRVINTTIGGGVFGAARSIPALLVPGYGKIAAFGIQQMDYINEEMNKDSSFDDIPENQKYKLTAPLGIVTGILEKYGFSNMLKGTSMIRQITAAAVRAGGYKMSASAFTKVVENDIRNRVARGTIALGTGALAEAETGALQEVAEISAKKLWNDLSSKGDFETPNAWSMEYAKQVGMAALQESIGGVVLGMPNAISQAARGTEIEDNIKTLKDANTPYIELFFKVSDDQNYEKTYSAMVGQIKSDINEGKITVLEATETLNTYNQVVGLSKKINPDLDIDSKKQILDLLFEEQQLKTKTEGKDPRTVQNELERINEIANQISKISKGDVLTEFEKEAKATKVTDEEVVQEIIKGKQGTDTYTTEEFEIMKKILIKRKKDAYKKQSAVEEAGKDKSQNIEKMVKGDTDNLSESSRKNSQENKDSSSETKKEKVDPLAINDKDSVKKESYSYTRERIEGEPDENFKIDVVTNKDGSRTFRFKLEDGKTYNTLLVSKDNTLTNQEYIEASESVEPGTINLTETVEGFENVANPEAVTRRKKEIAEQENNIGIDGKPLLQEASLQEMEVKDLSTLIKKINKEIAAIRKNPMKNIKRVKDRLTTKRDAIKEKREQLVLVEKVLKEKSKKKKPVKKKVKKKSLPGETAKNLEGLYRIQRKIFGLNRSESLAAAIVMDRSIKVMAKRAGITPAEMYKKIKFVKASDQDIKNINEGNALFQGSYSDSNSGISFVYDKDGEQFKKLEDEGKINKDKTLNDFEGSMVLHVPDAAFSGQIMKGDDVLVEGQGGMYFPIKYNEKGFVWASTKRSAAQSMANAINESAKQNNGVGRLALISTNQEKVLSSFNATLGVLNLLQSKPFRNELGLSEAKLKEILVAASKSMIYKSGIKPFKGIGVKLDNSMPLNEIVDKIIKATDPATGGVFPQRKAFIVYIGKELAARISRTKTNKNLIDFFGIGLTNAGFKGIRTEKLSGANLTQAFSYMMNEPLLRDIKGSDKVYSVIEVVGNPGENVVEVKSDNTHKTYPFVLKTTDGQDIVLNILKETPSWKQSFVDPDTGANNIIEERAKKIIDTRQGVSKVPLQLNKPKVLYQKATTPIARLADSYNFNTDGFSMSSNLDEFALRKAAEKLGYGLKRAKSNKYFFTKNDSKINPWIQPSNMLFQNQTPEAQGAMLASDGEFVIYAMTDPNVSTPLHELAHVYEHYLTEGERKTILEFSNKKQWNRDVSELFARGFEKYLSEGYAPNSRMEKIFIRFREWLKSIYNGIRGSEIDINLTTDMKRIYDAMLGKGVSSPLVKKSELTLLKDKIRAETKGEKEGIKNYRDKVNEVVKFIRGMGNKNIITTNQANAMISKALRTNFEVEKQVAELISYITTIYNKADLAKKINDANKLRRTALNNITYKIGPAKDLFPVLQNLFSIESNQISLNEFNKYFDLVQMMGERSRVLTLKESGEVMNDALDVLRTVIMVPEQVKASEIKEDTYDLQGEIQSILNTKYNISNVKSKLEIPLAKYLTSLTKSDLENLVITKKDGTNDYTQIETLKKILQNIEVGVVTREAAKTINVIEKFRKSKIVVPIIEKKVKFNILTQSFQRTYGKIKSAILGRRTAVSEEIRSQPTGNIDEVIGNYNNSQVTKALFNPLQVAMSKAEVMQRKFDITLERAEMLLSQKFKSKLSPFMRSTNEVVKSKYKLGLFAIAREFEANPGNEFVHSPGKTLAVTIEEYGDSEGIGAANKSMLLELQQEFSDKNGEISAEKIKDSFSEEEQKAMELIDSVSEAQGEMALFTSAIVRGERLDMYNYYTPHDVFYSENNKAKQKKLEEFKINRIEEGKPTTSTKAGAQNQRTPGIKPLNFDIISSTARGMKENVMDYHMTTPIRQSLMAANQIVKDVEANPESTKLQRDTAKAIRDALTENVNLVFGNIYNESVIAGPLLDKIRVLGYYAALASVPRAGAELGANLAYVVAANPVDFSLGVTKYGGLAMGSEGAKILEAVGSAEILKMYDAESLTGKFIDQTTFNLGQQKRSKALTPVGNIVNTLYNNIPVAKWPIKIYDKFSKIIISTPDRGMSRPLWFGSFSSSFKAQTGISLSVKDLIAIGNKDSKYTKKYEKEIAEARFRADAEVVRMATSKSPFNVILKLQANPNDNAWKKVYKMANGFMANFSINEFLTGQKGVRALYYSGDISRTQAAGIMAGVTLRMTAYLPLYLTFTSMFDEFFGSEDDDEEELVEVMRRQFVGTIATLLFRQGVGNIANIPVGFTTELINEYYGEDLRDGKDYDAYKHSVVYNTVGLKDIRSKTITEMFLGVFAGPFGPMVNTLTRTGKVVQRIFNSKTEETKQKYIDELTNRMVLELLGNSGLIPFYKDIRRNVIKEMFKDSDKSLSTKNKTSTKNKRAINIRRPEKRKPPVRKPTTRQPIRR